MSGDPDSRLHRALGVPGAVIVGLSAMLGTGVFAVWTPAWQLAGSALLVSLVIAAAVAMLNAVSTARLARVHPESGGAYAYGRLRLNRVAGMTAGGAFVIGKSASAAAASLTIGVYLWPGHERLIACIALALALAIDLRGIVKSTRVNAVLVAVVLTVVVSLTVAASVTLGSADVGLEPPTAVPSDSALAVVAAAGLLFVAFAGYARITVLGEEVRQPARTIPVAMVWSFVIVVVLYAAVGLTVTRWGERGLDFGPASLESIAEALGSPPLRAIVMVGAVVGAGSVLVTLIAGMGRTIFAMAAQGDAPRALAHVSRHRVPWKGAIAATALSAVVVLPGRLSWALGLSGICILTYYAVAHAASFTLPGPWILRRAIPVAGLLLCGTVIAAVLLLVR